MEHRPDARNAIPGALRRLAIEGLDAHNAVLRMIEMLSENST
jgi:hypothetical protein